MKKFLIIFICLFSLTGCNNNKLSLDKEFYKESKFIDADSSTINNLQNQESTFLVFTYNNYCTLEIPCEDIFKEVMNKHKLSIYYLPYEEMEKTFIHNTVAYAPSIIIISNGKIIAYLDSEKDEDLPKYQDSKEFEKWLKKYINL